eukprot:TRINITY_DN16993_c0_g1_i1.p1 TRINITY_DN16993_c0_g1~~TRINITY_DN16993_c0_g1_i1.p1  ORF type:complete len:1134 (+),score=457.89 TRINITY_DN16993_c0_g1_i1:132-3533(+)
MATPGGPPPVLRAQPQQQVDDDQERKILTQQVTQAFYHLEHAQKEYMGQTAVEGKAHKTDDQDAHLNSRTAHRRPGPGGHSEAFLCRSGSDRGGSLGGFKLEFTGGYITFIPELSVLFLACLLPVLALSGKNVLTTLLVGMVATYSLDYMNQRKSALASVWICVCAVWVGLYLSNTRLLLSSWLNAFIVLDITLYLLLLAVCATVQFKWLQLQNPELALASERMLLGLSPLVCLPLIFSGFVSFMGSQMAPIGLAGIMCLLHSSFYTLRKSAFKEALTPAAKPEEFINGKLEAFIFTALTLLAPSYLHIVINHKDILTSLNLLTIVTLVAIPALYLFYKPERNLWFLYNNACSPDKTAKDDILQLHTVRKVILAGSYLAVLHWLIYRVAFGRFAHLFSGVRPPFNVILISVSAYFASAVLYFGTDLAQSKQTGFDRAVKWTAVMVCMIVAAVAFTYAAGMPPFIVTCSALSSACLTSFCLEPKNVNNYLIFALVAFISLTWWMYQSFSFLVMDLTILGGAEKISLPQLSVYILWLFLIQSVIFPLGLNHGTAPFYISLIQQVCALTIVEHILYSQPENLYPAVAVFGTSLWGLYFVNTMEDNKKISRAQAAVLQGMYVAKAYLFWMCTTLPAPGSELHDYDYGSYTLFATFLFVVILVANATLLHYEKKEKKRRSTTANLAGVNVFCSVAIAFASRHSIVLALLELLTGDPPEIKIGRLLGLCILYAGLLQLPMANLLPRSHSQPMKICHGFLLAGALIALLDPVLEGTGEESTEIDIYEAPAWAGYVGVLSIGAVGATLLNAVVLPDTTAVRIAWWGAVSVGSGVSFTALFIPYATFHSYLLVSLVFVLVVLCIDFTHYNANAQKEESNAVWGLYTGALLTLLAALFDVQWRIPEAFDRNMQFEVANLRQNAILSLSIGLNLILAALIKLKLSDRPVLRPRNVSRMDSLRDNIGDGTHFGLLGNICVVQAYVSILILRSDVGSTGPGFPVMASALLLLMHDDGWMINRISDPEQMCRYVPPMVASLISLTYRVAVSELPTLLNRSPVSFAFQLTIFMLAFAIGASATYDLWIDSKSRRKQGGTDYFIVGLSAFLFIVAGTEGVRLTVIMSLIACIAPTFNDAAWTRKLASMI